jgi:hypothetical protein
MIPGIIENNENVNKTVHNMDTCFSLTGGIDMDDPEHDLLLNLSFWLRGFL